MSIYRSASVDEAPDVVLSHWSIREDADGCRYFVGFNELKLDGRMSTPIVRFDVDRRIGFTASGRRYILVGAGGSHGDGDYVWDLIAAARGLGPWREVTAELVPNWGIPFGNEWLGSSDSGNPLSMDDLTKLVAGEAIASVGVSAGHISTLPVFWRARAFGLSASGGSPSLRLLSQLNGECELRRFLRRPVSRSEMYLHAVRTELLAQAHAGGRIDPDVSVPRFLKIWVIAHENVEETVGSPVVRMDAVCGDRSAIASFRSADWCDHRVGPFAFAGTDGIWEIFSIAIAWHGRSQRA
jgi:hypothetical protein